MKLAKTDSQKRKSNRLKLEDFDDLVTDSKNTLSQQPSTSFQRPRRTMLKRKADSINTYGPKSSLISQQTQASNNSQLSTVFQPAPEDIDELIVNSKKINEVRTWLRQKINVDDDKKCLLVSGPAGCGKSSTIRLLCDELDIDFVEFDLERRFNMKENWDSESDLYDEAQVKLFREFVWKAQSSTVETRARTRKLIIIKELPYVFTSDTTAFFNFLRNTVPYLRAFLVFSITTIDSTYELSLNRLFPECILQELHIHQIKFNPIPKTIMSKTIRTWIDNMGITKNQSFINSIVEKADGDLRSAVSLLAMCSVDKKLIDSDFLCSSESSLDIFHFLGKILYAKRLEKADKKWELAESKLRADVKSEYRREFPPKEDTNTLSRSSTLFNATLTDFIMEHEPNFCKDPKVLSKVYRDICETSFLMDSSYALKYNPVANDLNRQITIRSVIFHNYSAYKNMEKSFYKLKKSSAVVSKQKCMDLRKELNAVYPSTSIVDTITYTIPLLFKVNSEITEEQAKLCESFNPTLKINEKRKSVTKQNRISFQICNDSD